MEYDLYMKEVLQKNKQKKKTPQKPKGHMMNPLINHKQAIYK